jgi:hypothetical protein
LPVRRHSPKPANDRQPVLQPALRAEPTYKPYQSNLLAARAVHEVISRRFAPRSTIMQKKGLTVGSSAYRFRRKARRATAGSLAAKLLRYQSRRDSSASCVHRKIKPARRDGEVRPWAVHVA